MKKLVVVESPSKAKTINKYLGKDYIVVASKGHIVDLPKSKMGIDTEKNFEPAYEITNKPSLLNLKKAYKDSDGLILAADLDREGEAIAWHVAQQLKAIDKNGKVKKGHSVERIVFSEISKTAINDALKHPRSINIDLVNAQQARRFLDRLVGYKLSPLLWKKIMYGLSAGRVQSVALRLIVDKENERDSFKPEEYWNIKITTYKNRNRKGEAKITVSKYEDRKADRQNPDKEKVEVDPEAIVFEINSTKYKLTNEKEVKAIADKVGKGDLVIKNIENKVVKRNPKAPFTTSTLQQAGFNVLGFSAKRTMSAAQKLYEAGMITYMRTDSTAIAADAQSVIRKYVKSKFGDKYLPSAASQFKNKSKSAQEAHEAIRPVDVEVVSPTLQNEDQKRIYRLIWERTVASQMTPAQLSVQTITADASSYEFKTTGSRVIFDGFYRVARAQAEDKILPEIKEGEKLQIFELLSSQHFTQPPARYSEASLIKKLEELGIGRPSTYSSIISTIQERRYVDKDGKYMFPTDMGKVVNKLLVKYFPNIVDYQFTSEMEDNLDKIAEGKLDWIKMLNGFYKPFEKEIKNQDKKIKKDDFTNLGDAPKDVKCPVCGSKMIIKLSKFGRFYSCSKFPECTGMLSIEKNEDGSEKVAELTIDETIYASAPKTEDGRDYALKLGRFGKFWAHPDYPKVKDIKSLEFRADKLEELFGKIPLTKSKKPFLLKKGRFGYFWAHPDYPAVKEIRKVEKRPKL